MIANICTRTKGFNEKRLYELVASLLAANVIVNMPHIPKCDSKMEDAIDMHTDYTMRAKVVKVDALRTVIVAEVYKLRSPHRELNMQWINRKHPVFFLPDHAKVLPSETFPLSTATEGDVGVINDVEGSTWSEVSPTIEDLCATVAKASKLGNFVYKESRLQTLFDRYIAKYGSDFAPEEKMSVKAQICTQVAQVNGDAYYVRTNVGKLTRAERDSLLEVAKRTGHAGMIAALE